MGGVLRKVQNLIMEKWFTAGGMFVILGFMWTMQKTFDDKIKRAYERLDATKDYQDKTFTRSDVCKIRHDQITEKLDKMDVKLNKLVNGRNG